MGAFYETIPESLIQWCLAQNIFWVATAPLSGTGHVNVSPKGGKYFGIVDNKTFWYLDLSGSGVETLSHLHEPGNARITIMFNAFEGPPKIARFWGKGEVLEYGSAGYGKFVEGNAVKTIPGTRAIVVVHIHQVGSSCGFSVPFYQFEDFRPTLNEFFEKRVASDEAGNWKDGIERYWAFKNAWSMDGLPAMKRGLATGKKANVEPIKKMVGEQALLTKRAQLRGTSLSYSNIAIALLGFCIGVIAMLLVQIQFGLRLVEM